MEDAALTGHAPGSVPGAAASSKRAEEDELPEGWQRQQLDELCELVRDQIQPSAAAGLPYVGLEHIGSGEPTLKRWGDPEDVRSAKTRFAPRDILYGKLRPYLDKSVVAPFAGICSTDILVFRAQADRAIAEFLVSAIHTKPFLDYAVSTTAGVNHPRTSWNALKVHALAVPPFPEQQAIAAVLRTVQGAKEACERVLAATRQLKQSLLRHLFTYGPVPLAQAAHVPLKESEVGPVPEHWSVVSIGDIETFIQYGTSSCCESGGSGLPVLRIPNVVGGRIDTADLKYLAASPVEIERHLLQRGDLLFVRTNGVRENVGRCAVYLDSPMRSLFASYLIRARLASDKALPEFVQLFTETNTGRASFTGRASGAADGKFNINTQTIRSTIIPLPPLPEQREIARQLSAVDAKLAAEESRRSALAALFQSLLHHLMTGRVRVPLECGGKRSATPLSPCAERLARSL